MSEDFEEKPAEPLDMNRYLDVARRRYPYFLLTFFAGWLLVWGASWVLPVSYKSGTLILVEQPTMPKDYVVSNVNEDLQERVQSITQQILSRTRLLQIIEQSNLYSTGGNGLTPDEKVARMRKDIELGIVHDATNLKITAFRVDYSAEDPRVAQRVTGQLANLFINENLEVRQKESEDTTKFLQTQLESARESLNAQDAKIRAFKGEHVGDLPTQQAANLQILAGMQAQLQNEQDGVNAARQQQAYLQTLIGQYRSLQSSPRSADGTALPGIEKELETLKSLLADLSAKYTDNYPDVLKVKAQIARAEKTKAGLLADMKLHANDPRDATVPTHQISDPTQNSPLMQLEGQLQSNRLEIENREHTISALKAKVGEYQGRLNEGPVREQQLADLTRGYDQSKANYDQLLKKESDSRMATSMEQLQKGQRFRMIDPPSLPLKPDFPNRLKFCGMGLGLGIALGLLVAGGLEFFDDRMHSDKAIKALLPMKIVSEIPEIVTPSDERKVRTSIRLQWAASALVLLIILVGSAFSYLRS